MNAPYIRKADAKGRTASRSGRARRGRSSWLAGEQFVAYRRELLEHPSWRELDINARRVLDRLVLEYMATGGQENGSLIVTYGQLVKHGCSRRLIKVAINQLVAAGLVRVTDQGGMDLGERIPSRYRITFLPSGVKQPPTDEWKRTAPLSVRAAKQDYMDRKAAARRRRRIRKPHGNIDSSSR